MKAKKVYVKYDKKENDIWLKHWTEKDILNDQSICYASLSCRRFEQVKTRCSTNWQSKHPSYAGVTSTLNDFQEFVDWSREEYGYNTDNGVWCLDKDILFPNNSIYSYSTCIFVPQDVNKFFCVGGCDKNQYPNDIPDIPFVGYSEFKSKYVVKFKEHRKLFNDPYIAHKYWQQQKINRALILQAKYKDHIKLKLAFDKRIQIVADDLANGRVTERF